ncbi:MAG TPA: 4'-phosphopantetheinyl transferase superfamily protein [Flavobacteriales bacterium]|nr:4'-phosphopantetheinyl transferase superfamily protein [Flavobacteriales bacterium]
MSSDKYLLLKKNISDISTDLTVLDKAERSRYDRLLDDAKKLEFLAGRSFLKKELAKMAHLTAGEIKISITPQGKPFYSSSEFEYPHFSISHSGGAVVLAFAKIPVGVDLESGVNLRLASLKPIFTDREFSVLQDMPQAEQQKELVRLFTMKEAFIKATDKKWGLDQIYFEWIQDQWRLTKPAVDCFFNFEETDNGQISVCLVRES